MDFIISLFSISIFTGIMYLIVSILLIWFFIKSAVASGVKTGIIKAYQEIDHTKKNPPPTEKELFKKEMQGWQ